MKKFKNELHVLCACMALGLAMTLASAGGTKAVNNDAEYWHQKYLQSQQELLLWRDIAHMYWQFQDYDYLDDKTWEPVGRHNFWDDCISETATYDKLDSIQQGDWEDFFGDW